MFPLFFTIKRKDALSYKHCYELTISRYELTYHPTNKTLAEIMLKKQSSRTILRLLFRELILSYYRQEINIKDLQMSHRNNSIACNPFRILHKTLVFCTHHSLCITTAVSLARKAIICTPGKPLNTIVL